MTVGLSAKCAFEKFVFESAVSIPLKAVKCKPYFLAASTNSNDLKVLSIPHSWCIRDKRL
jgi:hypothetical protein